MPHAQLQTDFISYGIDYVRDNLLDIWTGDVVLTVGVNTDLRNTSTKLNVGLDVN